MKKIFSLFILVVMLFAFSSCSVKYFEPCYECKGVGSDCRVCDDGICSECEGSGKTLCEACYGNNNCQWCVNYAKDSDCSHCDNTGECSYCDFDGYTECTDCQGKAVCCYCNGIGNGTCENCDGKRIVEVDKKTYEENKKIHITIPVIEDVKDVRTIGKKVTDANFEIIGGNGVPGDTLNPNNIDGLVVLYFWGTWLDSSLEQLAVLDEIASDFESVTVIAVHTDLKADTATEFIEENYKESNVIFAVDEIDEKYYQLYGGRGSFPRTVYLNEDGEIACTTDGAGESYDDVVEMIFVAKEN